MIGGNSSIGRDSGRLRDVSDFGFDAYALDDLDTSGQPHPLEIARDLIASGKPRAALDLLSEHHDRLVDDPEYLLLCSAAWWADGDPLRAQQALQGAARLAPRDPRPLQGLGELLAERGEHEKSEQLLAKARALEVQSIETEEPLDEMLLETEEDLIAFAERRERKAQGALTPRQVVLALLSLLALGLLIAGIVFVTSPRELDSPQAGSSKVATDTPATEPSIPKVSAESETKQTSQVTQPQPASPIVNAAEIERPVPEPTTEPAFEVIAPAVAAVKAPAPKSERPRKSASTSRPASSAQPRKAAAAATAEQAIDPPLVEPPSDTRVQAELGSMEPQQLTDRADKLYAQGHSGLAATYYRRALEIDPDYAPALVGMGRGILRAKKYSDAMKNATRALELARGVDARPGLEAAAIYQMGRVHYERGERDAARRLFRQSISLQGAPPEAWFYLGEALSSDNSPAARQAYEKYLKLLPKGHLADRARRAIQ